MIAYALKYAPQNVHFFFNKIKATINGHYSFALVLLEQNRTDKLVDIGIVIKRGELLSESVSNVETPR